MAGIPEDSGSMLDTIKADRSVWLMKCPLVIGQAWKEFNDSGQPLAKITVSVDPCKADDQRIEAKVEDPTAPSATQRKVERQEVSSTASQTQSTHSIKSEFMMEVAANGSVTVPKSYTLNMSNDIIPMYIFSETSEGKVSIDGKVEHKFDMKPHSQNIDDYRRLCRERTNKSNFRTRQVQVIDNDRGGYNPMQGMMDFSSILSKDRRGSAAPIKTQEMKRTRMDRGELENILFKLFERQSNWTLKQLVMETDQPQQFIKEILNDLGIYNKRGTNQGTYELKPEYKKTTEDIEGE
jgi:transcription initiation factor TFIIF subunit beta